MWIFRTGQFVFKHGEIPGCIPQISGRWFARSTKMPDQRLANPERRAELESASAGWPVRDLSQAETDALELYLRAAVASFEVGPVEEKTVLCDPEGVRLAVLHPGGEIDGLQLPTHHDFSEFRKSPSDLSAGGPAFAFFADRPIGRATVKALLEKSAGARLLILASGLARDATT